MIEEIHLLIVLLVLCLGLAILGFARRDPTLLALSGFSGITAGIVAIANGPVGWESTTTGVLLIGVGFVVCVGAVGAYLE